MSIIKAGYRVTVKSWENDADNYNTMSRDGLSEADTRFLVELCQLLRSQNAKPPGKFGNMHEPGEYEIGEFIDAAREVACRHRDQTILKLDLDDDDDDAAHDAVISLLSTLGLTGGEFFTRVVDKLTVEHVPSEINLEDVTSQFV